MELRHLRYFVVLAEELHFGRAASRLCITQPPLSFSIRQLEDELGVQLCNRGRTVTLTASGKAFLDKARSILEQSKLAKDIAVSAAEGRTGWLSVSFSSSLIYSDFPHLVTSF